ncbi:S66 family peptidase [Rouxiella badensis]|uniref:S66 family peptidase n=1 Tax=Rouxiella badensis TaxID=1646377 RepID=UPI001D15BD9F|nr:S66 peptidase family protein [Rouxiella badensis]MCC3719467.1 LD-carboxypeptidase [Rouxiella badensis]MCC3728717.1 LD-carboxypeptidase [Rouxiella badensis]MCC3733143.1 LD-carboxypeptidase [Rouxiella badensis]MCC3741087.1 LD-carboxypeptidase [Rouxiella badensis]MCC3758206.1 LD-carboxypeptidase [Rouxiella badensis]
MDTPSKTLLAQPLNPGETIGFFSPSSPVTVTAPNRFARARQFVESKGFRLKAGQLTHKADFYRAGSIQERAEELNQLLRDPQVRCVMSTIGGMNSNSLLPYLDYEAIEADPKIIIGYSDTTALLLGIYAQTGLITFYGPALVASFGEFPPLVDTTWDSFAQILVTPPALPYAYPLPPFWSDERLNWDNLVPERPKQCYDNDCRFLGNGKVSGRVLGGNLNTMSGIWGSPYMPEIGQGDILLIEDSLKDIATVERAFSLLKINGVFDRVAAILLGKHEGFNDSATGRRPVDVLLEVLGDRVPPLVDGFDCCHTHPMLTLPLGSQIQIDFESNKIELISPYLIHQ